MSLSTDSEVEQNYLVMVNSLIPSRQRMAGVVYLETHLLNCLCLDLGCEVEYASPYLHNNDAESGEGGIVSLAQEAFWEGALYFFDLAVC